MADYLRNHLERIDADPTCESYTPAEFHAAMEALRRLEAEQSATRAPETVLEALKTADHALAEGCVNAAHNAIRAAAPKAEVTPFAEDAFAAWFGGLADPPKNYVAVHAAFNAGWNAGWNAALDAAERAAVAAINAKAGDKPRFGTEGNCAIQGENVVVEMGAGRCAIRVYNPHTRSWWRTDLYAEGCVAASEVKP